MSNAHRRIAANPRPGPVLVAAIALIPAAAAVIAVANASASNSGTTVKAEQTALGRILVDNRDRTLYMFALDKHGKSACYGACAKFWPPLLTNSSHVPGAGVRASMLGTTMRTGGTRQITYAGHPLYLFIKDSKPGQTKGQGLNASGGLWWVVSPAGTVVKKTTSKAGATTPAATTTTGGGGYGGG